VANTKMPIETGQCRLVENLGHKTEIFEDGQSLPIRGGDSGRLLAAMLECEQSEVDQVRDTLSR
jgi:hypothetical protein